MIDYKKVVLDWLIEDYVNNKLKDNNIDIHVDQLLNIRSSKKYIIEGIKLYKALIDICLENDLLDCFIPVFRISLKETNELKKIKINSLDEILEYMNHNRPPEICLYRKFKRVYSYIHEEYKYSLTNCYFDGFFKENFYCYCGLFRDKDDIMDDCEYSRMIVMEYNNNKKVNPLYLDKLVLKS